MRFWYGKYILQYIIDCHRFDYSIGPATDWKTLKVGTQASRFCEFQNFLGRHALKIPGTSVPLVLKKGRLHKILKPALLQMQTALLMSPKGSKRSNHPKYR